MPSARELLEQADALMRRNRAGMIDTEIPELRDVIAMAALAPNAAPVVLDEVPELTEAIEEIEIESIVELPEDVDESSGWLHHDHGELSVVGKGPDEVAPPKAADTLADVELVRSALAVVAKTPDAASPPPVPVVPPVAAPAVTLVATPAIATVVAAVTAPVAGSVAAASGDIATPASEPQPPAADEWARWEVLADEIRMQVLQRIDIFTETRLRDQLSAKLQPVVDKASAEMVSTINEHVGGLLRAYIAEAIEREIEKWRGASH